MAVPESIQPLVEKYTYHREAYIRGQEKYNESQLRQDFTDPFFHALGWDVNNNKGHSEAYREVLHEEPVRIRGTTKYFDYTFRIGGVRKFIVETKKPSVHIRDDADAALQLRRYAWNAKLPLSILTNFEEWAIYDCTIKPENGDTAAKGRIEYFTYKDIPAKWDYLVSVFSQDCILKGSFDRYAASHKGKKGTAAVDDDILSEIESWRDALAKNIAIRNDKLSVAELNTVVQRTIDRLLFLRICEDRGIEEYTTLHKLLEGENVYARLCELFRNADAKYNSGLFHFDDEPGRNELPDTLSLSVSVDDKVLKGIIKRLYYPETPYLFSVIPPAILGHVYEQFLGKVIRLTEGHQAKVEFKPEVKKAGGVFYTPQYIVEYIVAHTVGELVKDKTPRDVAKLRVLDPACGSGSFLIGAYQFLLDWHRDWYIANLVPVFIDKKSVTDPAVLALLPEPTPRGKKKLTQVELPVYKAGTTGDATRSRSDWRLTTAEKKRILLNTIYGVDIDQAAVEVTKLSLLLKVLEEENEENIDKQLKLFAERALPSLHENIKCGNSLIGTDIITPEMPAEEVKRINPFDWDREFADVMKAGGFDAVIGNPPYIRIQMLKEWAPTEVEFYKKKFLTAGKGNYDIYVVFVEKGRSLLTKNGLLGYILPHKFFTAQYGEALRTLISKDNSLKEIVHFGHQQIFTGATTYTCLLFLKNCQNTAFHFVKVDDIETWKNTGSAVDGNLPSDKVGAADWNLVVGSGNSLFEKLKEMDFIFKRIAHIFVGTQTSGEDIFVLQKCKVQDNLITGYSKAENQEITIEKNITKWFLKGRSIRRFEPLKTDFALISPYEITDTNFKLYSKEEMTSQFPLAFEYFTRHKKFLTNREKGKFEGKDWWAFGYPKSMILFQKPKIICPFYHITSAYAFDRDGYYFKTGYGILLQNTDLSYEYILGLLNSKLLFWYYQRICTVMREGYSHYMTQYIEQLPIRTINFTDPADKARHDRMVTLVTAMLDLNKKLQDARVDHEKTLLQRQIEATDAAIDKLVYELYGLTDEEIAVIENRE
ncbi:N-6 DNA methylase [Methanoregula sp.]|uniref:Eco57I restriction-modification methylase domain-containing protein n=1 Tax=Methanoregula sp. TaxID=2052170 RepID=UPI0026332420|nr:N-6 DNA methylase [Methanoregula sp.]MDD5143643.1 Eco57I restriction-modification methylase domain-containing protein [Methanoregula sp.]